MPLKEPSKDPRPPKSPSGATVERVRALFRRLCAELERPRRLSPVLEEPSDPKTSYILNDLMWRPVL